MAYYWLNEQSKQPGDIVAPGNWGRIVMANPLHAWRRMEGHFENMRLLINPSLPSRLECAFVCEDLGETIQLLRMKRPNDHLYKVELTQPDLPMHRADMAWVHPDLERWNAYRANPRNYWTSKLGDELKWPEILTLSPIKIIERLD